MRIAIIPATLSLALFAAAAPAADVAAGAALFEKECAGCHGPTGIGGKDGEYPRLAGLPAGYLSAGQRRRLSLARLIAASRPVWLLDEPTSALDAAGQEMLAGLMRDHLAGGGIILAATHAPLGIEARELRLARPACSPLAAQGWAPPQPDPCAQGSAR